MNPKLSLPFNASVSSIAFHGNLALVKFNLPGNLSKEKRAVQIISFMKLLPQEIKMITKRSKAVSENTEDSSFQVVPTWDVLLD